MFDSIRSHRRWLMLFLMLLVFPSFVFFGVQGYNRFMQGDQAIARVGGQSITPQEFDAAQRQRLDRMRDMLGPNFDAKLFDTPQARASVLDSLIGEKALAQETAKANVSVSVDRMRSVINAIPDFQQDGKFSYERYKTLLAAQGQDEHLFEQRVRTNLVQQTLLRALADSSFVPRTLSESVQRLAEEEREFRELRFRAEDFVAQVKVSDAAINDYYTAHRAEFETPESVRAEYVVLTLDSVAAQISVPEADLRGYYDQGHLDLRQHLAADREPAAICSPVWLYAMGLRYLTGRYGDLQVPECETLQRQCGWHHELLQHRCPRDGACRVRARGQHDVSVGGALGKSHLHW